MSIDAPSAARLELGPAPVPPPLHAGDPAPWFRARSDVNPDFRFSALGGRYVILSFLGSFGRHRAAFEALLAGAGGLPPFASAMLLVSADPADEGARVPADVSGTRFVFDEGRAVESLFHALDTDGPTTYLIDERLRVRAIVRIEEPAAHAARVLSVFERLPPLPPPVAALPQAPVLIIPHVFERELCRTLIDGYRAHGGTDSGFMVEREGRTVPVIDHGFKRRTDWNIEDAALIRVCHLRIRRRIVPEIRRAYQFDVSRIERNIVACYSAETRGHFGRHRDNTTRGTRHRRFAVSINLDTEDHDGGELVFPEFGGARFRPPTGGACVFSCSLLHEAMPVTRGERHVFVPFLYDDAAAVVRQENVGYVGA